MQIQKIAEEKIKIVHVTQSDMFGLEAEFVRKILKAQLEIGCEVYVFVFQKIKDNENYIQIYSSKNDLQNELLILQERKKIGNLYSLAGMTLFSHPHFAQADVVHLHGNITSWFSWLFIPFLSMKKVFWSLYEASMITAGCLTPEVCDKWRTLDCQECLIGGNEREKERRVQLQKLKKELIKLLDVVIIVPSLWFKGFVEQSLFKEKRIEFVQNGVDADAFMPKLKEKAKRELGIITNKKIILFVGRGGFKEPCNGGQYLKKALEIIKKDCENFLVLEIGGSINDDDLLSCEVIKKAWTDNDSDWNNYYNAADVFVYTSQVDVCAYYPLLAMASGTPVVAFASKGTVEIITHLVNGILIQPKNFVALAQGIMKIILDQETAWRIAEKAREKILEKYTLLQEIENYQNLYERELLKDKYLDDKDNKENIIEEDRDFFELWADEGKRLMLLAQKHDFEKMWSEFQFLYEKMGNQRLQMQFTDVFFANFFSKINPLFQRSAFWEGVEKWLKHRKIPIFCGVLDEKELMLMDLVILKLVETLKEYFKQNSLNEIAKLSVENQWRFLNVYRYLICNPFSAYNLLTKEEERLFLKTFLRKFAVEEYEELLKEDNAKKREKYLLIENKTIVKEEERKLDGDKVKIKDIIGMERSLILLTDSFDKLADNYLGGSLEYIFRSHSISLFIKTCLLIKAVSVKQSNLKENQAREKCIDILVLARIIKKYNIQKPLPFFNMMLVLEQMVLSMRRIFLANGAKKSDLEEFGTFVSFQLGRMFPEFKILKNFPKGKNKKIRVGFVSRYFCFHEIGCSIIKLAKLSKKNFECFIFMLGEYHDAITDDFIRNSTEFVRITEVSDLRKMAQKIREKNVDILIYLDPLNDPQTYFLAAFKLAKKQMSMFNLLTTGLPSIKYHLTGEIDFKNAKNYYKEKIISLSNMACAENIPKDLNKIKGNRSKLGIPDNATVLFSTAKSVMHLPERDDLFRKILERHKNVYIILLPFMVPMEKERIFALRFSLFWKKYKDDFGKRFMVLEPCKTMNQLWELFSIADIYLDSKVSERSGVARALCFGLPVITEKNNGSYAFATETLEYLGVKEGAANNKEEYLQHCDCLIKDILLRKKTSLFLKRNAKKTLAASKNVQKSFEEALLKVNSQIVFENYKKACN